MKKIIKLLRIKYSKIKAYSYLINIFIFLAKIFLFFIAHSLALAISSLYNLGIGLARKNIYSNKDNYTSIGLFVIMASVCFIIYSTWTIISHKIVNYNLYVGITLATVTFFDISYSIYGIRSSIKNHSSQKNILMLVNLATALISLELTQSAILSFTETGVDNSLYNGIIGNLVGISSLIIGLIICFKKTNFN